MPALNRLDQLMIERLPKSGIFLEVGANDGFSQSNTYYLERAMDWRGILIEPLPSLYRRCRRLRSKSWCVNAACVADDFAGDTVELVDIDLMSVTLGQQPEADEAARLVWGQPEKVVQAPARRITEIIESSPFAAVDFMSIDVEGAEVNLLRGLDLARFAPRWMLIETAVPQRIDELVAPYLRRSTALTHHDYLYERID
jgi:FkbM family methyltransferase